MARAGETDSRTAGVPRPTRSGDDHGGVAGPPLEDTTDFDNANRGFIAAGPQHVTGEDGKTVWDLRDHSFLLDGDETAPPTVHPHLWRQGRLTAINGLFEVVEGIYQIRGMDLSNMTLIEGDTGVIVVDPLVSEEVAAAGLELYRRHRSDRPVTAVIYTHPHLDHFGGVAGVVDEADVESGKVPVVAPEHFMEHAVSENVYAGTAMIRRGMYFTAFALDTGPEGFVGVGLGPGTSQGRVGLIPPTLEITRTGQEETLDGVRFVFQMTPGTEAPAEMNFHLPDRRALCTAENACHTLHNLLTLRGAQVRDARMWSRYLNETIELFADDSDVVFASHHWPIWGPADIRGFLAEQRDVYAYLHDQTLRMMNKGSTGIEIAEELPIPPGLEEAWSARGYYGSISHNVKAVYQRYMGWFDGNPAHLWQHPPQAQGERYARAMGGIEALLDRARSFADEGDLRFAAELASHAVFAEPGRDDAKELLAEVLTRLGHGAECATWRNFFLVGAKELREGVPPTAIALAESMASALSVTQMLDSVAIRVDGPRAWKEELSLDLNITDSGERYRAMLSNGVLIHYPDPKGGGADLSLTLTKRQLLELLATGEPDGLEHEGDTGVIQRLMSVLDEPRPDFPIVTP
ncbi:alkyl/aryl-sulfatase [Nocardiopsis lambiniae]|uniref:Alkyl sulfatase dimerization domain-containing protein n=1 Tax=Nocardiopsis lambiniae TaxID=3075539 RepID=A0ABU2MC32_9ACTN|nr:alkyl sulfatase dimerization domain-containing protein [Nocardiopsis sp. DSM 44743]MDT0329816.1 alkyl sulfatase dimerization domain-containing protein [Nocardiopsis sp. DSM 44743]